MYIHAVRYEAEKESQMYQPTFEEVFDKIACDIDEKKVPLSNVFWDWYEKVKKFREHRLPTSEQSLEQKALNNLNTFIKKSWEELLPYMDFLRTLREDIIDYGTLSDYTLRRIANMLNSDDNNRKRTVQEISSLKDELGEDYLQKEKDKQKDLSKEIIIAIENRKL